MITSLVRRRGTVLLIIPMLVVPASLRAQSISSAGALDGLTALLSVIAVVATLAIGAATHFIYRRFEERHGRMEYRAFVLIGAWLCPWILNPLGAFAFLIFILDRKASWFPAFLGGLLWLAIAVGGQALYLLAAIWLVKKGGARTYRGLTTLTPRAACRPDAWMAATPPSATNFATFVVAASTWWRSPIWASPRSAIRFWWHCSWNIRPNSL